MANEIEKRRHAVVRIMREIAGGLSRRRIGVWRQKAKIHTNIVSTGDTHALIEANSMLSDMLQTKNAHAIWLKGFAVKQLSSRLKLKEESAAMQRFRNNFQEELIQTANEFSMQHALKLESAAFHNEQLQQMMQDNAVELRKRELQLEHNKKFNTVMQEQLHENLERNAQDKEAFQIILNKEMAKSQRKGAFRIIRHALQQIAKERISNIIEVKSCSLIGVSIYAVYFD